MKNFTAIWLLVLVTAIYFIPIWIANWRHTRYRGTIFLTNLFFAWTVVGWIAVLIWAILESREHVTRSREYSRAPF